MASVYSNYYILTNQAENLRNHRQKFQSIIMKNNKITIYLLSSLFALLLTIGILTSSTTVDKTNNENIIELTKELSALKAEVSSLKETAASEALDEPMIGEITIFAGQYAPEGWAFCDGQLLFVSQNQALFSILGNTYGGDGRKTFALPDLRGRSAVGFGNAANIANVTIGEKGGKEEHRLSRNEMPQHNHDLQSIPVYKYNPQDRGGLTEGEASLISVGNPSNGQYYRRNLVVNSGRGESFSLRDPYLGVNYIIALKGTYPSRN